MTSHDSWPPTNAEMIRQIASLGIVDDQLLGDVLTGKPIVVGDDPVLRYALQLVVLALTGKEMPAEMLEAIEDFAEVLPIVQLYGDPSRS